MYFTKPFYSNPCYRRNPTKSRYAKITIEKISKIHKMSSKRRKCSAEILKKSGKLLFSYKEAKFIKKPLREFRHPYPKGPPLCASPRWTHLPPAGDGGGQSRDPKEFCKNRSVGDAPLPLRICFYCDEGLSIEFAGSTGQVRYRSLELAKGL